MSTIKSHQQDFSYLVGIFSSLQIVNGEIANFQINDTQNGILKFNTKILFMLPKYFWSHISKIPRKEDSLNSIITKLETVELAYN